MNIITGHIQRCVAKETVYMFQTAKMLWLFLHACIHIHMSCHMWESLQHFQYSSAVCCWLGVVLITVRGYIFIGPTYLHVP